jgi:hypothetical protein
MAKGKDDKGRFTIGHLWSIGNNGGRPAKYETAEALHEAIGQYLEWEEKTSKGKYTLEGAALFLGFASVQSMYDYEKRDAKFSYIINRYRLFLTHYHAQRITWAGSYQGSAFWLKNFAGYKDEQTVNQNQKIIAKYGDNDVPTSRKTSGDTPSDQ